MEVRKLSPSAGKQLEEVPLRYEGYEVVWRSDLAEVNLQQPPTGWHYGLSHLAVGQGEEIVDQAHVIQHMHCGRVYGVTPEVAQEVAMFLQNSDIDSHASEQESEHHARRTPADDATGMCMGHRPLTAGPHHFGQHFTDLGGRPLFNLYRH